MSKYDKEYQKQYRARNREIIKAKRNEKKPNKTANRDEKKPNKTANRKQYFAEYWVINKQTIKIKRPIKDKPIKGKIRYVQLLISENNNPLINLCEFILLNKGI